MSIDDLFRKLIEGKESAHDFAECASQLGCGMSDLFNKISVLSASKFLEGSLSFEDADGAMNGVWGAMLHYTTENNLQLVEPCYSIYCAFDEGEYDHRDGSDPVERYTRPALEDLLKNA